MAKYSLLFIGKPAHIPNATNTTVEWDKWVKELKSRGIYHSGTAFSPEGKSLVNNVVSELKVENFTIGGYVVLQTDDFNTAVDIAKTPPHGRWGGVTEVRFCRDL